MAVLVFECLRGRFDPHFGTEPFRQQAELRKVLSTRPLRSEGGIDLTIGKPLLNLTDELNRFCERSRRLSSAYVASL
jgi:hypothetical protein